MCKVPKGRVVTCVGAMGCLKGASPAIPLTRAQLRCRLHGSDGPRRVPGFNLHFLSLSTLHFQGACVLLRRGTPIGAGDTMLHIPGSTNFCAADTSD